MKKKQKVGVLLLFCVIPLLVLGLAVLLGGYRAPIVVGVTFLNVLRMWWFQANPDVQVEGCWFIAGVVQSIGANKDWLLHVGAIDLPIRAMKKFPDHKEVQRSCAEAVSQASLYSYQNQQAAGARGAVELVVDMMKRWSEDPTMQRGGISGCFMDFSEENRKRFSDHGGIEVLLSAIENHFDSPDAVVHAWYGFSSGTQPPNAEHFVKAGGLAAGVKCMRLHGKSPRVREEVMQAFRSPLLVEDNRIAVADAGYIADLVTAMREAPMDYHQISPACANIRFFTWNKNNTHLQLAMEAGAVEVGVKAVADFPSMKPTVNWAPEYDQQYTVYEDCLSMLLSMCLNCKAHKAILEANGVQIVRDMLAQRAMAGAVNYNTDIAKIWGRPQDAASFLGTTLLGVLEQPCDEGKVEAAMEAVLKLGSR